MFIRKAGKEDITACMEIYEVARGHMRAEGNTEQWINGYPSRSLLDHDVEGGNLYLICDEKGAHGVFMLKDGPDPTYGVIYDGAWLNDDKYVVIHRIAGDGTARGILRNAVEFASQKADSIRIDTHASNISMRAALERNGFSYCGRIIIEDGTWRIAYQRIS